MQQSGRDRRWQQAHRAPLHCYISTNKATDKPTEPAGRRLIRPHPHRTLHLQPPDIAERREKSYNPETDFFTDAAALSIIGIVLFLLFVIIIAPMEYTHIQALPA